MISHSYHLHNFHCILTQSIQLTTTTSNDQPLVVLTSESLKNKREYADTFNNLVSEYDQRLDEQVKLARQDMLHELEVQIQVSHAKYVTL